MNTKKTGLVAAALLLQSVVAWPSSAQTIDHLRIWIRGVELHADGGAQPRVASAGSGLAIGQPVSASIWKDSGRCVLNVAPTRRALDAEMGWTVEATPIKVLEDAVTFSLEWRRDRDKGKDSAGPGGKSELTLRPGEALPVDIADLLAGDAPAPCAYRRVALLVAVDYNPPAVLDRRVVATDLWLVRRLANGSTQSEPLSVRGQLNRPTQFFFATVSDSGVALDFFGEVTVKERDSSREIVLITRSRLIEGGRQSESMPQGPNSRFFVAREVTSTLQLKPDEVVSVELPRLGENASGAFANQTFAITVRSQRIR
jgi:hypothetical protein